MKTVIVTLLAKPRMKYEDVDYFVGFHHLVQSLKRHNSHVPPIVVLSPDIETLPPGADHLVKVDPADFEGIKKVQMCFGLSVYFKLDMFRLNEKGFDVDRIIYLDTDVLTFQSVEKLWDESSFNEHAIYGIREDSSLGLMLPIFQGRLNVGVLVINKSVLGQSTFDKLIGYANEGASYDLGDQGVIGHWLDQENLWGQVGVLPTEYHLPSSTRTHGDWDRYKDSIRVMHYLGPRKPWRDRPEHEWYHADTQELWDEEVAHHDPVPQNDRPNLGSSLYTRLVRVVQGILLWFKGEQAG